MGIIKQKSNDSGHTYFVTSFDPNLKLEDLKTIEGNTGSGSISDQNQVSTLVLETKKKWFFDYTRSFNPIS